MKKLYFVLTASAHGTVAIHAMVFADNKEAARLYFQDKFPRMLALSELKELPINMVYEVESV